MCCNQRYEHMSNYVRYYFYMISRRLFIMKEVIHTSNAPKKQFFLCISLTFLFHIVILYHRTFETSSIRQKVLFYQRFLRKVSIYANLHFIDPRIYPAY